MLVFARHGQTSVNAGGRLQGRIDAPLTELGRRQAAAIGAALAGADLIVTSPLLRARQTAEAIGSSVVVDDRWIELDYGEWDGLEFDEVPADAWRAWRSDPTFAPPGGESLVAVGARVRHACEELLDRARHETVVVVSHVSPVKAAVAWALGVGDEVSWRMHLDVGAICRIAIRPAGPALVRYNELSHLSSVGPG